MGLCSLSCFSPPLLICSLHSHGPRWFISVLASHSEGRGDRDKKWAYPLLTFHWPDLFTESQIVTREIGKCSFLLRSQIPRYSSITLDEVFRPAISLCQGSIK